MGGNTFEIPSTESKYVAHVRRAVGAIRRRFGGHVAATDIVHDVIVEAFAEKWRTGQETKGFWRRLTNKVFDNYRREHVHKRMLARRAAQLREEERKSRGRAEGEEKVIESELREEIGRVVAQMSEADREIWRRLGVSESYAEIANAIGKSPKAVKQAAYRIRARVRAAMSLA